MIMNTKPMQPYVSNTKTMSRMTPYVSTVSQTMSTTDSETSDTRTSGGSQVVVANTDEAAFDDDNTISTEMVITSDGCCARHRHVKLYGHADTPGVFHAPWRMCPVCEDEDAQRTKELQQRQQELDGKLQEIDSDSEEELEEVRHAKFQEIDSDAEEVLEELGHAKFPEIDSEAEKEREELGDAKFPEINSDAEKELKELRVLYQQALKKIREQEVDLTQLKILLELFQQNQQTTTTVSQNSSLDLESEIKHPPTQMHNETDGTTGTDTTGTDTTGTDTTTVSSNTPDDLSKSERQPLFMSSVYRVPPPRHGVSEHTKSGDMQEESMNLIFPPPPKPQPCSSQPPQDVPTKNPNRTHAWPEPLSHDQKNRRQPALAASVTNTQIQNDSLPAAKDTWEAAQGASNGSCSSSKFEKLWAKATSQENDDGPNMPGALGNRRCEVSSNRRNHIDDVSPLPPSGHYHTTLGSMPASLSRPQPIPNHNRTYLPAHMAPPVKLIQRMDSWSSGVSSLYTDGVSMVFGRAADPPNGMERIFPTMKNDTKEEYNSMMGDEESTCGLSVASTTYGDDRQKVFNAPLTDARGNKGSYTGLVLRNTDYPHGLGRMDYEMGGSYEGNWRHGLFDGEGSQRLKNDDCYTGEFKSNKFHGEGFYRWNDGRVYVGNYFEGERHGKGRLEWQSGDYYEGEWEHGKREGQGTYFSTEYGQYEGSWKGNRYHGYGVYTWNTGRKYEGEWKDGKSHGHGKETLPDGRVRHEGTWVDDEPVLEF